VGLFRGWYRYWNIPRWCYRGRSAWVRHNRNSISSDVMSAKVLGTSENLILCQDPLELQDLLDELELSRQSRKRACENLQEIRWVLKEATGIELPAPARKTIDLEGRIVKDGVRKAVKDRQLVLDALVKAIGEFRKFTDQPLTLCGSDYAHAVQELNKAIDRAQGLLL
jgi:hypothetical protein